MSHGVVANENGKDNLIMIARIVRADNTSLGRKEELRMMLSSMSGVGGRGMNKREFPEGDVSDEVEECRLAYISSVVL